MFHHCSTEPNKIRVLIGPIRAQSEDELCHIQSHLPKKRPTACGVEFPKEGKKPASRSWLAPHHEAHAPRSHACAPPCLTVAGARATTEVPASVNLLCQRLGQATRQSVGTCCKSNHTEVLSFLPSSLVPSSLPSVLPSFLLSFLPSFLSPLLPFSLPSFLHLILICLFGSRGQVLPTMNQFSQV